MCDFAHIFCTRDQTPTKPGGPPNPSWWPTQQQHRECVKKVKAHLEYCKAINDHASHDEVTQCYNDAIGEMNDCYTLYGPPNGH